MIDNNAGNTFLYFLSINRFYVNDVDNEVISRDILLLDIICSINPDDLSDIEFLWDVWYNMTLTEDHHRRLKIILERLLSGSSTSQWQFGDTVTKKQVIMTWKSWLETEPWDIKDVNSSRQDFIEFYLSYHNRSLLSVQPIEPFCKDANVDHMLSLWPKRLAEFKYVHQTGKARDFVSSSSTCNKEVINPTMMRPGSSKWHVHYGCNPIQAYLPFER